MKAVYKALRDLVLALYLLFERLLRSVGKVAGEAVYGAQEAMGYEQYKDQRLREIQEMTDKQTFEYWTGVLSYWQKENPEWKDGIEEDLWAMAAAYREGNVKQFIKDKLDTPMYTPHNLEFDGEIATLTNQETGEKTIIKDVKKETKPKRKTTAKKTKVVDISGKSNRKRKHTKRRGTS